MGAGLLERELPGCPGGRIGVGEWELFPARFTRGLLGLQTQAPALRYRITTSFRNFNLGFRVARTITP